ncbi:MAG: ABC transporter ATP-binding protein [Opitutales bacterium]
MAQPPAIVFDHVSHRFQSEGPNVLEGIDLRLEEGEFVSLVGPSGSGKSTLLRLAAGLIKPQQGNVHTLAKPPVEVQRQLAFIFQEATLFPWLDALRNVELPLKLRRTPKTERRAVARELLELVGLGEAASRYPDELSGGMKMRVSVARALSSKPRLLLLDEPFAALDELIRDRLDEDLLSLRERDRWSALFVTHSVAEAVFLSNRVWVLSAAPARIVADIEIPFGYPRTNDLRSEPDYHAVVDRVSKTLRANAGDALEAFAGAPQRAGQTS